MSRIGLKQVIGRSPETRALVETLSLAFGGPVAVEDTEGRLLHGAKHADMVERFAVTHDDASIGWVSGAASASMVARVLDHIVAKEAEKKALGAEVLHLYRELNLIYSFSEKLAALLEVERVAALTLQEARHLIVATDGVIMLLDDETGLLTSIAGFGDDLSALGSLRSGEGLIGAVVSNGVGEIVNDADADPRLAAEYNSIKSLIAAPLRVGERVTGVIALGSTLPLPYTAGELKLVTTLALQTATAIENARLFERTVQAACEREQLLALHQQAEIARAKLESELMLAARIQAALFPASLPRIPGYDLAATNRPALKCGGDYYDAIVTGEGDDAPVLFCVADVSGKGLPASLVMSNMQATLRALLGREPSLAALAARASELLFASTAPEKYVTAAFARLAPASGIVRFLGAGHLDTLILKANGEAVTLSSTGLPLGLLPAGLPYGELEHRLESGDMLVLFSDGVTEAQNERDEEFGDLRLLACLRAAASQPAATVIERVVASIDEFVHGSPQFDDITVLVARRE
jgi:serine phosphatase RsbU (regulator of sigma subunit)